MQENRESVYCEGRCRMHFNDRREAREYTQKYCASVTGWKKCTLAQSKNKYYERTGGLDGPDK